MSVNDFACHWCINKFKTSLSNTKSNCRLSQCTFLACRRHPPTKGIWRECSEWLTAVARVWNMLEQLRKFSFLLGLGDATSGRKHSDFHAACIWPSGKVCLDVHLKTLLPVNQCSQPRAGGHSVRAVPINVVNLVQLGLIPFVNLAVSKCMKKI